VNTTPLVQNIFGANKVTCGRVEREWEALGKLSMVIELQAF
jgi:hypothetical protein